MAVDVVVNAANSALAGGGGVDAAIHRAAGLRLGPACRAICGRATGQSRVTPGIDLRARWIVHTVGPVWQGGHAGEAELLAACYRSALRLAAAKGARSVAFPAISCGVYGYPPARAAVVAITAVGATLATLPQLERVIHVVPGSRRYRGLRAGSVRPQRLAMTSPAAATVAAISSSL